MSASDIELRPERIGDEAAIDVVVCRAFNQMDEVHLVRLLRGHCPTFDRRFSIAAWHRDLMVGHIMLTPAPLRLMGRTVPSLAVAPVSVIPEFQRTGVGGQLLRAGHELGKSEGFEIAFLVGHPEYYPKHGYLPAFGFEKVTIDVEKLPAPAQKLHPYPVRPADIPWLTSCFAAEWRDVDFCWQWGSNLDEWTLPGANALVWWTEFGKRAAYTLGWPGRRQWKMILADDPLLARGVIEIVRPASLMQHPSGWLAKNVLDPAWGKAEVVASPAAMAHELRGAVLRDCLKAREAENRLPGACCWPVPFMPCM
ncbi:MAG: N-acetyltransferase [Candidatus Hydrogenedentes bacterium]|nr:N-acetyltransferase [Candidatus Hydrogenedentota bacterium]